MNDDDIFEHEIATIGPRHLELRVYVGDADPGIRIATAAPPWVRPRALHVPTRDVELRARARR